MATVNAFLGPMMLNEYSVVLPVIVFCVSLYFATRKQLALPVVGRLTSPGLFGFWFPGVVANILNTREVLEKGYRKVCGFGFGVKLGLGSALTLVFAV